MAPRPAHRPRPSSCRPRAWPPAVGCCTTCVATCPTTAATVVLVGFQAEQTRGRQLADGARQIKLLGHYLTVHAEVVNLPAFSVHADQDELLAWLGRAPKPPHTLYVVHGEPRSASALARLVTETLHWNAVVPRYGERVRLDV